PFLWMISASFKSNQEVVSSISLLPKQFRVDIIIGVWQQLGFWKYFLNSFIISASMVIGVVVIYSLAGYGFSKTTFWGRDALFLFFVGVMLVPGVTVLIPLVQLLKTIGLIGPNANQFTAYTALVLPSINGAGPLALFLFRNYFGRLPDELRDAARVDGCNEWGIFARIFLPIALPVIATVGVLNFISSWNSYIWPSVVLNNSNWYTLPLQLQYLDQQSVIQWNIRMAGSLITTVPLIIGFIALQRYYISGITAGALKG
ncbi:MAG TPA: carbohydrate ABC transporter permease, partial [Ktedonobacteraceae bacterium]